MLLFDALTRTKKRSGWARSSRAFSNPYSNHDYGRVKKKRKSRSSPLCLFLLALGIVALAWFWKILYALDLSLYENRIEFIFVRGHRSAASMWSWMLSPLIEPHSAAILWDRFWSGNHGGHSSTLEDYDPERHNNAYRHVEQNVLNQEECAVLRNMALKEMKGRSDGNWDEALHMEFQEAPLFKLLGSGHITDEENELLFNVLGRIQRHAEVVANNPNIYMDYGSVTLRNNKIPTGWSNFVKRWWFRTSSGHGIHADQCRIDVAKGEHDQSGWLGDWLRPSAYSFWNHDFECHLESNHCCFYRTHTSLLYLNDPEDQSLFGGELFLLDRKDVSPEETEPIYNGAPLSKQAEHVLIVKPTCGTLAIMASDTRNIHGTMPMSTGQRFALPIWFTSHRGLRTQDLSDRQLDQVEDKSREACKRIDTSELNDYPPPGGLLEKRGDCDAWLDSVRDPDTWLPY